MKRKPNMEERVQFVTSWRPVTTFGYHNFDVKSRRQERRQEESRSHESITQESRRQESRIQESRRQERGRRLYQHYSKPRSVRSV